MIISRNERFRRNFWNAVISKSMNRQLSNDILWVRMLRIMPNKKTSFGRKFYFPTGSLFSGQTFGCIALHLTINC